MKVNGKLEVSDALLDALCRRWKIDELSLFGSVLRDDFGRDSDVDVLVTFDKNASWTLLDLVSLQDEMGELFGRKVDIAERPAVERSENYIRRRRILDSAET